MHEPKQPQETKLAMFLGGLLLAAVIAVDMLLLALVGGPMFHLLWWGLLLVGVVGFTALFYVLFVGGNNHAQNAASFRRLPSPSKLIEIASEYPPESKPFWA